MLLILAPWLRLCLCSPWFLITFYSKMFLIVILIPWTKNQSNPQLAVKHYKTQLILNWPKWPTDSQQKCSFIWFFFHFLFPLLILMFWIHILNFELKKLKISAHQKIIGIKKKKSIILPVALSFVSLQKESLLLQIIIWTWASDKRFRSMPKMNGKEIHQRLKPSAM